MSQRSCWRLSGPFIRVLGDKRESSIERSEQRHKFKYMPNVPGPVLGLLWMAFLYLLSLMHEPASVQSTMEQAIRWSTYAAYMWLAAAFFGSAMGRSWLSAALQAAGAFVIWGALAGWMGWISFPAIVMTTGDLRLSAIGARLSGFVQYPNFLGAVMSAYLVWFWLLLVRARTNSAFWFAAVQVVPVLLVLLLTESRGAWLVGALGWVVGLVLVSRDERPKWLLYSGCTLAAAGGAYRFVVHIGGRSGGASVERNNKGDDPGRAIIVRNNRCCSGCICPYSQADNQGRWETQASLFCMERMGSCGYHDSTAASGSRSWALERSFSNGCCS